MLRSRSYAPDVDRAAMTPEEAAAVLRRAAELQAADLGREDALDAAAVVQLGSELGLREDAVRSALAERPGPGAMPGSPVVLGLDAEVLVRRRVGAGPQAVQDHVGRWLQQQCMQRHRRLDDATTWRPRTGPLADLRRGLDLSRRIVVKGVAAVEVRTQAEGTGTHVSIALSMTPARAEALGLLVALPTVAVGTATAVAGVLVGPEALLALPLTGAAGGAGWLGARTVLSNRKRQVADAVEGVLDGLPTGRRDG